MSRQALTGGHLYALFRMSHVGLATEVVHYPERPTMALAGGKVVENQKNIGKTKTTKYLKAWP